MPGRVRLGKVSHYGGPYAVRRVHGDRAFKSEFVQKKGHTNRSEALRDLVREALSAQAWEEGGEVLAVIVLIYDHRQRGLLARLTQAQHQALASLHIHLDEENCLEVVAVRGPAAAVQELADRMRAEKGVKLGRLCPIGTHGPR